MSILYDNDTIKFIGSKINIQSNGSKSCSNGAQLVFELWEQSRDLIDPWDDLDDGSHADSTFRSYYKYFFSNCPSDLKEYLKISKTPWGELDNENLIYPYVLDSSGACIVDIRSSEVVLNQCEYEESCNSEEEYVTVKLYLLNYKELEKLWAYVDYWGGLPTSVFYTDSVVSLSTALSSAVKCLEHFEVNVEALDIGSILIQALSKELDIPVDLPITIPKKIIS